ncbi:sialidase family protein [Methylomonas sp. AM2-LC]|uniref:sialidase family protein n=1 Tax=Methylomonas sp. AM2-LC TaxID=3153301 RepID=UPI003263A023
MNYKNLLLVLFTLTLCACATDYSTPLATQASHQQHHGAESPQCSASKTPSIQCSKTVTSAFDHQGRLWVTWVDHNHIYLQSSLDQGDHFSAPQLVNRVEEAVIAHGEYRPKIKFNAQDTIFITWTVALEKKNTGHIRFSRSSDGGNTFSEPVTINDNLDVIGHRFDSLLIGKNGELWIAWLDARDKEQAKLVNQPFEGSSLYFAYSEDGGITFHANQMAINHTCECCRLGLELDNNNLPVVLWRHVFAGNIRDHALLRFQDSLKPGTLHRVSNENWQIDACPHHGPALAIDSSGNYHVAWFSGASGRQGLFYANSSDGGLHFSNPYPFASQGAGHPAVISQGQTVALLWSQFDGEQNQLILQLSHDSGVSWNSPQTIARTALSADDGFLLTDGQQLYVSWQTGDGYQFMQIE